MNKPMNASPEDFVWGIFTKVTSIPAKLQDMCLNAVINTIDKIQTEQALREAELEDRRRAMRQSDQE